MTDRSASVKEIALVTGILALAGALIYGPHVVDGGFTIDDWSHAATAAHPPDNILQHYWTFTSNRPILVGYVPLTHWLFGPHPGLHNAWSIVLAVAMAVALYAVLRRVSLRPLQAWAIALLVLLFPWSDSTRFWATASHISLSIAVGLAGILLALRGLDARDSGHRRASFGFHAGAVILYAISVLTYEIAGVALLFAGALYLTHGSWSTIRLRWAVDVAVILPCLAWTVLRADRERPSLAAMIDHADAIADTGASIIASATVPFGNPNRQAVLVALGLLFVIAILVRLLRSQDDALRHSLNRWLAVGLSGLMIIAAGWVLYVPADPYYLPGQPGVGNRVNALAAVGIVIVIYAALALLMTLLTAKLTQQRTSITIAASTALAMLLAVGYADRTRDDQRAWAYAATASDQVLDATTHLIEKPVPGGIIYTFGQAGSERPGITIFSYVWDLHGAIRLTYDDPTLAAYPILEGTAIDCGPDRVTPVGPGFTELQGTTYGSAYFVDVPTQHAQRIDSHQACEAAQTQFRPGPAFRLP